MDKVNLRKIVFWTVVFWAIIGAMAPWLDRANEQPIRNSWVLAEHSLANPSPGGYEEPASFPMWGYSFLMRLFGSITAVVVVQSFLGALATALLMVRLNSLVPQARKLTMALFLTSFPWLSWMAIPYQLPMGAALAILGLLAMERSLQTRSALWGLLTGALFGLGQNFRSELLLLPGLILIVVLLLRKVESFRGLPIKPLVVCAGTAFIAQIPWAVHCYFHAGRFSLSESNLGHVAFLGLGNLPGNPWGITPRDDFAQQTVTNAGLKCSSLSFKGSDYLMRQFFGDVKEHPLGYAKSVAARVGVTIALPFGFAMLACTPAEKETVRALVGLKKAVSPNAATEKAENSGTVSKAKVVVVLVYVLLQCLLIAPVSILGIIGFFLAMRTGPFRLTQPLILCLSIAVLYRCGLNVALAHGARYMATVYLCYLPFVANTLWQASRMRLWNSLARRRPGGSGQRPAVALG